MFYDKGRNIIIHKENSTRCNNVSKFIIPYLYKAQHVSGDTPPNISSLKLHWQPLVFHTWKVFGHVAGGRCQAQCAWQRPPTTRPTTFQVWKPRGCQCSFRLLMMGGVSPEKCWALYKYGIINFDTMLHLVGFSLWILLWCTDPRTSNIIISCCTPRYVSYTPRLGSLLCFFLQINIMLHLLC